MAQKLEQFRAIKATGRPIRIWVVDEARLGLHTIVRRAWGLPGHRIVMPMQRKYQVELRLRSLGNRHRAHRNARHVGREPRFFHGLSQIPSAKPNLTL